MPLSDPLRTTTITGEEMVLVSLLATILELTWHVTEEASKLWAVWTYHLRAEA